MGNNERLMTLHGQGVGETADALVSTAQACGYSVAATGPGQFRLIREKRPTWAIVAAILTFPFLGLGLLFLLIKKTDSGTIAVFEGRDGTKVRFVGSIDDEIIDSLGTSPKAASTADADPGRVESTTPPAASPRKGAHPENISRAEATPPEPAREPPVARYRAGAGTGIAKPTPTQSCGPSGLIDTSPIAKNGDRSSVPIDPSVERTVARSRRSMSGDTGPTIVFPDGRSVAVSRGLVIGRSPTPPDGKDLLVPMPYGDASLSKTHLMIEPSTSGIEVTDLHSTNGTSIVNQGETTPCRSGEPVLARPGSDIVAGDVRLRVESDR